MKNLPLIRNVLSICLVGSFLACSQSLVATVTTVATASGNITSGTNWAGGVAPAANEDIVYGATALVGTAGVGTITLNTSSQASYGAITVNSIAGSPAMRASANAVSRSFGAFTKDQASGTGTNFIFRNNYSATTSAVISYNQFSVTVASVSLTSSVANSELRLGNASNHLTSFTVNGTTSIGNNSILTNYGGSRTFTGLVTINSGGRFNFNTSSVTLITSAPDDSTGSLSGLNNVTLNGVSGINTVSGGISKEVSTVVFNGGVNVSGTLATVSADTAQLTMGGGTKVNFLDGSTALFSTATSKISFATAGDWLSTTGNTTLTLGFTPTYSNTYTLFSNVTTSGLTFSNITGYDSVNYVANFAQNGTDYNISFAAVPEPSTYAAIAAGIAGLAVMVQRRRMKVVAV